MWYRKNLPAWERALRVGSGIVMGIVGYYLTGAAAWLLIAGGIGTAVSGVIGFCPMYALVGRRLP